MPSGQRQAVSPILGWPASPSLPETKTLALCATPILLGLAYWLERKIPAKKDWPYLALLGFLGVFLNQILFLNGLNWTTASNASILMPSIPVFASLTAAILGIERLNFKKSLGIGLAVAGALAPACLAQPK